MLIGLGVAAGGVLAVAAGTYFGVRANSLGDEVTRLCANAGGECSTWTGTVKDKEEQGRRYDTYSKVMLFTGIPALLGGLGWAAYWHWTVAPLNPDCRHGRGHAPANWWPISFQGTF